MPEPCVPANAQLCRLKPRRRVTISGYGSPNDHEVCSESSASSMKDLVCHMKRAGVLMLALDWDLTVIGCHTKNGWYGTAAELEPHIRPKFRTLIRASHKEGLIISIVTFSTQVVLVQQALQIAFPDIMTGDRPIIVRGNCGTFTVTQPHAYIPENMKMKGKIPHILSAIEAIPQGVQAPDNPNQVVLIDDDCENIGVAMESGFHCFWMNPDCPRQLWLSMMVLFGSKE